MLSELLGKLVHQMKKTLRVNNSAYYCTGSKAGYLSPTILQGIFEHFLREPPYPTTGIAHIVCIEVLTACIVNLLSLELKRLDVSMPISEVQHSPQQACLQANGVCIITICFSNLEVGSLTAVWTN